MTNELKDTNNKQRVYKFFKSTFVIHILILVFFMLVSGVAAVKLGQDVNFDLHNYHYNNPHALLNAEIEKNIAVSGIQSYENPLRDTPAYLLMSNLSPKKAGFAIGALQGINLWLVFEILFVGLAYLRVGRLKRFGLSFVVALFTLLGSGFNSEVGTTMGDNTTSIFVLASLLLLIYSGKYKKAYLGVNTLRFFALMLIGISAGLKLTNIAFVLGIFIAAFFIQSRSTHKLKVMLYDALAVALGVLISGGLWYLKMWLLFRNPIFPFYNGVFKSEYYPAVNFVDTRWTNAPLWQAFFEPFSYVRHQAISSEMYSRDPRLAIMFILLIVVFLGFLYQKFKLKKSSGNRSYLTKEHKALFIFIIVSYVAWCVQFSYYRYLIAVELVSLVAIALCVFIVFKKFWLSSVIICLLCVGITLSTIQTSWGRVSWQPTNFGVTQRDFAHMGNSTLILAGYQPYAFVIPYLPSSTKVLRVTSDLSSEEKGTKKMQALINERISHSKAEGRLFYLLVVDEDRPHANTAAKRLGFKIENCSVLPVTVRDIFPNKYRLCNLAAY